MEWKLDIGPYDPCPCGSGEKYKFCCAAKAKANRHGKYPMGTVAFYGPDDKTTTKIVAGVLLSEEGEPILQKWMGSNLIGDAQVGDEIKRLFAKHGVKNVIVTNGNLGCPHEEGIDFPLGQDCPVCPFWAGKQGTARRARAESDYFADDDELESEDLIDELAQSELDDEADDEADTDFDACFSRIEKIIGDGEKGFGEALDALFDHLQSNLRLPCEVTGSQDFRWEEPYVIGGWSRAEHERLRKTQPSYMDHYELQAIERHPDAEWLLFDEDMGARVKRISDGKLFLLGLAELEATDRQSPNHQLLNDYCVWFVNSR